MRLLITGATGKVGRNFLDRVLSEGTFAGWSLRVICHNRSIEPSERIEIIQGSFADPDTVSRAMQGVTHVLHMAAVKESPDLAIDIAIKGMFLLLESARALLDTGTIHPDQRRLRCRAYLPRIRCADYRNLAAKSL